MQTSFVPLTLRLYLGQCFQWHPVAELLISGIWYCNPRRCSIRYLTELLYFWIKSTNVCLEALMLSDCCIHLISLLSTTSLYIATEYAGLGAFDSECKLQRIRIQPGLCQALIW